MDFNGFNGYEYTVDKKCEGTLRTKTVLLVLGYMVFSVALIAVIFSIPLYPLGAVVPILIWMLVFFTWRYVKISYSYTVESGVFKLVRIYGNRTKRCITEFRLKDCALIAPFAANTDNFAAFAPVHTYDALPSKKADDAYLILATDKNGKKIAIILQVTVEALKTFKYYNQNTVMAKIWY